MSHTLQTDRNDHASDRFPVTGRKLFPPSVVLYKGDLLLPKDTLGGQIFWAASLLSNLTSESMKRDLPRPQIVLATLRKPLWRREQFYRSYHACTCPGGSVSLRGRFVKAKSMKRRFDFPERSFA